MNANNTESIKLKCSIVDKVREYKGKTGVPITVFFERAAQEKLSALNKISSKIKKQKNHQ